MKRTLTVDAALDKAKITIKMPVTIMVMGSMGLCFHIKTNKILNDTDMWIILVLGLSLAGIYWFIMIGIWRTWAFEHVDNINELKKQAVRAGFISARNAIFEKPEMQDDIKVQEEKKAVEKAKYKPENDDHDIPDETIIYYARVKNYIEFAVALALLGLGIYMAIAVDSGLGIVFSVMISFFAYKEYREATNTKPQIILNEKGMQTISTPFYKWSEIKNEEAINIRSGKHNRDYLMYDHPGGSEKLTIDQYKTTVDDLNKLMALYKNRSNKRKR